MSDQDDREALVVYKQTLAEIESEAGSRTLAEQDFGRFRRANHEALDWAKNVAALEFGLPESQLPYLSILIRPESARELATFIQSFDLEGLSEAVTRAVARYQALPFVTCHSCLYVDRPETFSELVVQNRARRLCAPCYAREEREERKRLNKRGIRSALARARAARLPATLTEEEWRATVEYFDDACAYCGGTWYVVEHVTPLELGGGTVQENCVPACYGCNMGKGGRTPEDLRQQGRGPDPSRVLAWLQDSAKRGM